MQICSNETYHVAQLKSMLFWNVMLVVMQLIVVQLDMYLV